MSSPRGRPQQSDGRGTNPSLGSLASTVPCGRMPGLSYLGVTVDVGDPAHLKDGERLLDDLAARVRDYPPDLVRAVRVGVTDERSFVRDHAGVFMDLEDLRAVRGRIEARRD